MSKNKYLGTSFDDFLAEEDLLGEVEALAIKRLLVRRMQQAIEKRHLSKDCHG